MEKTRFPILLITLAAMITACSPSVPAMTSVESLQIDELTSHMTTRCVGRYLIDLPAEMEPVAGPHGTEAEDISIEVKPLSRPKFNLALTSREATLRGTHMDGEASNPYLKSVIELGSQSGLVFNRAKATGSADVARVLELWSWRDGHQIVMTIQADDPTDPKYADHPRISKRKKTTDEKLAHLLRVYERVRGRQDTDIPSTPGFCFANGFIEGKPGKPGKPEKMNILYAFKNIPDVTFGFEYDALFREDNTLLERSKEVKSMIESTKGNSLRKGKKQAGGIAYEEWLLSGITAQDIKGNMFTLESSNKTGKDGSPFFVVDMLNGTYWQDDDLDNPRPKPSRATLSDAQSIFLWDKVVPTLRPQPGAF